MELILGVTPVFNSRKGGRDSLVFLVWDACAGVGGDREKGCGRPPKNPPPPPNTPTPQAHRSWERQVMLKD